MHLKLTKITILVLLYSFLSCSSTENPRNNIVATPSVKTPPEKQVVTQDIPVKKDNSMYNKYPWMKDANPANALVNRILPPSDYFRTSVATGSFADWLRHLPLKPEGSAVYFYNGGVKSNNVHEAVIDIDTGKRDLQQCADAVMRVKAEYHFSKKEYSKIHFNYTSGHKVAFDDWRQGRKPVVRGNSVNFTPKTGTADNSYSNFKKYMYAIFNYAGTASLSKELKPVTITDMQIGDIFIQGGFPGHAVVVVDMVENAAGKKAFLLAQSYMPAQDMHILQNPKSHSPWYDLDFGHHLSTPEWSFTKSDIKRFY